jgi:hypothetical protein
MVKHLQMLSRFLNRKGLKLFLDLTNKVLANRYTS